MDPFRIDTHTDQRIYYTETESYTEVVSGELNGYHYKIRSCGLFPTAYVYVPNDHPCLDKESEIFMNIPAHGGIDYIAEEDTENGKSAMVIGWSFDHFGDYINCGTNKRGKRYTLEEVYGDIVGVINYLRNYYSNIT